MTIKTQDTIQPGNVTDKEFQSRRTAGNTHTVNIIVAGFTVSILLMLGLVLFGLSRLNAIYEVVDEIVNKEHLAIESLYVMQGAARERSLMLHDIVNTEDPFDREEKIQEFTELGSAFGAARQKLLSLGLPGEEQALLEEQLQYTATAVQLQWQVIDLAKSGRAGEARQRLIRDAIPAQNHVMAKLKELLDHELKESAELHEIARLKRNQAHLFMAMGGAAAVLLTALIMLFVNRKMSSLVSRLVGTMGQLKTALKDIEYEKLAMDKHAIVSITDADGRITYANDKFIEASGYSRDELIGQNHRLIKSDHHNAAFFEEMWSAITQGQVWQGEICNRTKGGVHCWMATTIVPFLGEDGRPYQHVAVRTDITHIREAGKILLRDKEQLEALVHERAGQLEEANKNLLAEITRRQELEEDLRVLASTDKLTGILNRRALDDAIRKEIERARRSRQPMSLILFDVDHFKPINDNLGHQTGDMVLSELARIVAQNIRGHDVFARWGGEEFVILCINTGADGGGRLAEKLRRMIESLSFPRVDKITCSFGVTELRDSDSTDSLIKRADTALYRAKQEGRNRVSVA